MYFSKITAIGACVPDMVITNDDMAKIVDTSDEWISSRSGIRRRHLSQGRKFIGYCRKGSGNDY